MTIPTLTKEQLAEARSINAALGGKARAKKLGKKKLKAHALKMVAARKLKAKTNA
jgi:hypothetical protein